MWRIALSLVACAALANCAGGPKFSELFDDSAAGEGTGFQGAALVRAVVILARHEATPRQRAVAQANAERAVAKLERQIAAQPATPKPHPKKHTAKKDAAMREPNVAKTPKTKLPARIAVRTVKDEKTAPQAAAAVMIYDVQARRIVGNEVYDVQDEPPPNATVKFDTSVVRYVGAASY